MKHERKIYKERKKERELKLKLNLSIKNNNPKRLRLHFLEFIIALKTLKMQKKNLLYQYNKLNTDSDKNNIWNDWKK